MLGGGHHFGKAIYFGGFRIERFLVKGVVKKTRASAFHRGGVWNRPVTFRRQVSVGKTLQRPVVGVQDIKVNGT